MSNKSIDMGDNNLETIYKGDAIMKKGKKVFIVLSATAMLSIFAFTGCRKAGNGTTATVTESEVTTGGIIEDLENGASEIGSAVENAGDDLVDKGMGTYDDAHSYLMTRFTETDKNGKYEVRKEKKDLVNYATGKQGYQFELYNTASGEEKVGEFYIDATDGSIHKMNEKTKAIEPYTFK